MSFERKQPKKETTLARLTRQQKALERLVNNHNKAVARERVRIGNEIERQRTLNDRGAKARMNLHDLYEDIGNLELADYDED